MGKRNSFRLIQHGYLLKLGCPAHIFAKGIWNRVLPDPIAGWGHPVEMADGKLVIAVRSREYLDAFRSQERVILDRFSAHGLLLNGLVVRVQRS